MTNSEARMARLELIRGLIGDAVGFDIRHSDFFRHLSFVIYGSPSSLTAVLPHLPRAFVIYGKI